MGVLTAKIVSMCVLGGVSLLLGILPIKIAQFYDWKSGTNTRSQFLISALSCFGAGVILTTCLTHMLPEVNEFLEFNIQQGTITDTGLPLAEIFVLCGFFMIYLVEELVHIVIEHWHAKLTRPTEPTEADPNLDDSKINIHQEPGHADHAHEMVGIDIMTGNEPTFQSTLRGFLIILALSLHAVFEGIAVGLTNKEANVWYLLFAIAAHKFVIAFCLGIQFVTSGIKPMLIIIYIGVFALISPLGIVIGTVLTGTSNVDAELQNPTITILQGLATGTLLYVVFFEVLEEERVQKKMKGIFQALFVILGFVVMVLVQLLEVSQEDEQYLPTKIAHHSCTLDPKLLETLERSVNITCFNGQIKFHS
eukprot:maker-scaffold708_size108518-snap-gene-0.13 protein:Tk11255 transcript:maker-scaffold708_size108518-snap-gene-0.13-mRNA-1 annotation:"zinc transporter zip3 isoform x1"